VTESTGHDRATDQAVASESTNQLREALGRLGAEQSAPYGNHGEIRLIARPLGDLGRAPDQTLGVARGIDDGLGVQVDDGTLLLLQLGHGFMQFSSFGKVRGAQASGQVGHRAHAYRENTQIIRARRDRTDFAAAAAAMTGAAADPTRRRRPPGDTVKPMNRLWLHG
jgi:hypothetical protein